MPSFQLSSVGKPGRGALASSWLTVESACAGVVNASLLCTVSSLTSES